MKSKSRKKSAAVVIGMIAVVIAIIAAGCVLTWIILVTGPWTPVKGQVRIPGLHQAVEIARDSHGIVYIDAQDQHDLLIAQRFVHAQDRLWQMEMFRRTGKGALSAFLGKQTLEIDIHFRTIGLSRMAQAAYNQLEDEARACLEDYAAGVNAYLEKYSNRLPIEYALTGLKPRPWIPEDTLIIAQVMAYNMGINFWSEIFRTQLEQVCSREEVSQLLFDFNLPPESFRQPVPPGQARSNRLYAETLFAGEIFSGSAAGNRRGANIPQAAYACINGLRASWGSNNWVVHGSRTTTGKPFLGNDTHLEPMLPSVWYENSLRTKGLAMAGFSMPGIPLVITGHNEKIAWGITDMAVDCQDLYLEKVDNPADPKQYLFKGKYRDIQTIKEEIAVKNAAPFNLEIRFTQHGPFVNKAFWLDNWELTTFKWAACDGGKMINSLVRLNKARNWGQFTQALGSWDTINLHFVYADTEGNIGYQAAGKIPRRTAHHSGNYPVPGWDGDFEWEGYIPYAALPREFNPPAGFIATANNGLVADGSGYKLAHTHFPGFRSQRLEMLLSTEKRFAPEDLQQIMCDTCSPGAAIILPYLLSTVARDAREQAALDFLAGWDLRMEAESTAAAIYATWYAYLLSNTVRDELKAQAENYLGNMSSIRHVLFMAQILKDLASAWFDDRNTPQQEDRQALCSRSLARTIAVLERLLGKNMTAWKWGKIHRVTYKHQPLGAVLSFFNKTYATGGGDDTLAYALHFNQSPPFRVVYSASQRMITDLADFDATLVINSTGQNANWLHPHRTDQSALFRDGEWLKMGFRVQETGKQGVSQLVLFTK